MRQYIPTIDELEYSFHITAKNNAQYVTLVCRVDKPDQPGGYSSMHLTEIIQNVIESESRGEHVMELAPTPTQSPARQSLRPAKRGNCLH
jgi:hypothetical protein